MKIRFEIKLIAMFVLVVALTTFMISILSRYFIIENFSKFCSALGNELPKCLRDDAGQTFLRSIEQAMVISGSIALLTSVLLSLIATRILLRPLKSIISASRQFAAGNYNTRINIKTRDEFNQLINESNDLFEKVENQDALRKNLIANFSHEISTPLTNIYGYIEALKDGVISSPKEVKKALEIIRKDTEQVINLSKETKELSLLESGQYQLTKKTIYLNKLIKEVIDSFILFTNSRNIKMNIKLTEISITGDEAKIRQAVSNVIQNAIIYSKPNTNINVSLSRNGLDARIVIKDEGVGISMKELKYIYERFYRGDIARTMHDGSGIGLAITKAIIEKHGGKIEILSKKNRGTKVTITLPINNTK